jgi:hypothetical protein
MRHCKKIISAPTLALIERVAEASGRSTIQYLGDFLGDRILDTPWLWADALLVPQYSSRAKADHAAEVFSEQYGKFCRNLTLRRWFTVSANAVAGISVKDAAKLMNVSISSASAQRSQRKWRI